MKGEGHRTRSAMESKKWKMSLIGLFCVMLVYFSGLITMVFAFYASSSLLSLATTVVAFIGSVVSAYVAGESMVDWKRASVDGEIEKAELKKDENTQSVIQTEKITKTETITPVTPANEE